MDDGCVHDRARRGADPAALQILVHRVRHLTAQFMCFQQMTEVQDRGLIRHRRAAHLALLRVRRDQRQQLGP